jgi:hypothetical protein
VSAYIYIEGGAKGAGSKFLTIRCQEAFHKLLDRMGFKGRKPRLKACGGRKAVYDDFAIAHLQGKTGYVAMWIDSEEVVADSEATWAHLKSCDGWDRPDEAEDEQVLFMTTCMETWIVTDRSTLREHFGNELQESALSPLTNMEIRHRHDIQAELNHATRDCSNHFKKGERSFEILGKLNPDVLERYLPSFVRVTRILNKRL